MRIKIKEHRNIPDSLKTRQLLCLEVCVDYLENPEIYTRNNGSIIRSILAYAHTDIVCSPLPDMEALLVDFRGFKDGIEQVKDLPEDLAAFIAYAADFGYNALIIRDNEDMEDCVFDAYPGIDAITRIIQKEKEKLT